MAAQYVCFGSENSGSKYTVSFRWKPPFLRKPIKVTFPAETASLARHAKKLWSSAYKALQERPFWERCALLFWLLGPFILLIERTPADAWLSILAIAFIARAIIMRTWDFTRHLWVRLAFLFMAVCLVSAALSDLKFYSLGETIAWFRFPVFAMATAFWLATDRRLLHAMLILTAIGSLVMCTILLAELVIEGQKQARLTWPYDDLVPGNYLAKVGMPAFVIMVALILSQNKIIAGFATLLTLVTLIMSMFAGERINLLLLVCSAGLAVLVWRLNKTRMIGLVVLAALAATVAFMISPETGQRLTTTFYQHITNGFESDHIRVVGGGVAVFEQAMTIGIGPGNYRLLSEEMLVGLPHLRGDNHPHNYYIQLLAETGIFGALAGTAFLWAIIWKCVGARFDEPSNVVSATAFIVPLAVFWPIATTADFFGQWNNIFMWSGVALALAAAHSSSKK